MIEAGKVLQQRYRIDKQIGQGGMGAVYVATDERFGSVVAIKETLFMDSNFRKAIEREARLLNSLRHPALPRVSDHFEENDSQYLVMEYIQGEDLGHILEEHGEPFPVADVVKWADQLLDALDFLHNQDIPVIHRDIKPQNLKLTGAGQIILLDFGLAKGNPTDAGHQTAAKSIFGYSRNYASLEQIQGTGTDPRSDLYSLGATLYHLVTGVPPEDALTRAMSVLSKRPDTLRPANVVRPEVPRGIAGVLQRSLDLNAAGRPESALEMRQMFRESENYAYLADVSSDRAVTVTGPADHSTRAGRDTTDPWVATEAKTEVMPAYLSELTSVRQLPETGSIRQDTDPRTTAARSASRRPLAAALGSVLLVGAAVASGVIYYQNQTPAVQPAEILNQVVPVADAAANSASGPVDAPLANANAAAVNPQKAEAPSASAKTSDTAKSSKTSRSDKAKGANETIDIEAPADEDIPGDVMITQRNPDGTTSTMRVLKKKGGGNMVPPPGAMPGNFPFDTRYMTPAQRQKLRKVLRPDGTWIVPPVPPKQQP